MPVSITGIAVLYFVMGVVSGAGVAFVLFKLIITPYTHSLVVDVMIRCLDAFHELQERGASLDEAIDEVENDVEELCDKWKIKRVKQ
jgi:hypothetical protein